MKFVEFYAGPLDGAVKSVPDDCESLSIDIEVGGGYSPTGRRVCERHFYKLQPDISANTIDQRETFRWYKTTIL